MATPEKRDPKALPRGASGLPREHVSEIQRMRILSAMAEVASEMGAGSVTVAHVVSRAGVSRRTFYDLFADREECFLATFEEAIERGGALVISAYDGEATWRERIRAGLWALLQWLDEDPATARLCIVESLAAGPKVLARRAVVLRALVQAIDEGRNASGTRGGGTRRKAATTLPPLTAEGVVGAVLSVIHTRLSEPGTQPLTGLLGQLMGVVVLPYLGQAAAEKELNKPAPQIQRNPHPRLARPVGRPRHADHLQDRARADDDRRAP